MSSPEQPARTRHQLVVADRLHGILLQDFLQQQWPEVDRGALRNLVLGGGVSINAAEVLKVRHRLRGGDVVDISMVGSPKDLKRRRTPAPEALVAEPSILHEDDAVLVVAKPAGVAPSNKSERHPGVLEHFAAERPGLRLVHPADKDASGCLVLAKDLATLQRLETAIEGRAFGAEYLALVHGCVKWSEREAEVPVGPDTRRPGRIRAVDSAKKGARDAVTRFVRDEVFRGHSLVRAFPLTWRNHQIRVHLAHLGHPIVADPDYGVRDRLLLSEIKKNYKGRAGVVERPLLSRMYLHLARVRFDDPDGTPREISAPLPKDLRMVRAKMQSFARKD